VFVYRITTAKWAGKLSGSGYPARWNSKGLFVIYTASTRALACLENLVHRSGEGLPGVFKITEIEIPDSASFTSITDKELPADWHLVQNSHLCREIGDQWILENKTLLLIVPSAVIRDENNVLINPNHPDFELVKVTEITAFEFDKRL
jgi:RES domain-containing protein